MKLIKTKFLILIVGIARVKIFKSGKTGFHKLFPRKKETNLFIRKLPFGLLQQW